MIPPSSTQLAPRLLTALGLAGLLLFGCPTMAQDDEDDFFVFDEGEDEIETINDPFEGFNRAMFSVNDSLYRGVLKPVARGLRVVPEPARVGASNFFANLGTPISAINALLQLDLRNTGVEVSRFVLNSTIGVLGLIDVASDVGLQRDREDFGQTLGHWGVGHGFYLVVPFLGPGSLRDFAGRSIDVAVNPINENLENWEITAISIANAEVSLSLDADTYEALYEQALDPYIFFRSAYFQNRAGAVDQ